jgi:hypothetical protein
VSCPYVFDMLRLTDAPLPVGVPPDRDTVELGDRPTMSMEAGVRGRPATGRLLPAWAPVRRLMEA